MQKTFEYIKRQDWFLGVRADESLLFYSAKGSGYRKHLKKEYGVEFAETLLVPLKKNYPIRVFNSVQAKEFHRVSESKVVKDPKILSLYIKKHDLLYRKIEMCGRRLEKHMKKGDYQKSLELYRKMTDLYELTNAYFIIIFSLGLKLAEKRDIMKNVSGIIRKHDIWRNSVAFKEERLGEKLFHFFKFAAKKRGLRLNPLAFMKFLTLEEAGRWVGEAMSNQELTDIIISRKKHGFVYINLRKEKREIIGNPEEIMKVKKYFLAFDKKLQEPRTPDKISGQVAFGPKRAVRGEVIIIKDKSALKKKFGMIKGKVLVAIQTTPHFIPYMRWVRAIVTDEGGITCHAAITAREMKKPCLVGTKVSTKILKDGDMVNIDFKSGTLEIIDKQG